MRLQTLSSFFFISIFFACYSICQSQTLQEDSTLLAKAQQHLNNLHNEYIGNESALYNGRQYVVYAHTINEGIPFFVTKDLNNGTVVYNGVTYKNVPLLYDIFKNMLITIVPVSNYLIQLNNSKISSFSLLNHYFINIEKDSAEKVIKPGFYDVLYNGKIAAYKKQIKTLGEDLSTSKLRTFIIDGTSYYIKKDNKYYSISNKGSLLSVLKDKKKQVQDYMKKNKLNIREDKDNVIAKVAAFYDQLLITQN